MKNTLLLSLLIAASCFISPSCKDEKDASNCAADYAAAYTAATNTLTAAITAYALITSPTAADCTTLKAAWQTYIDALSDFDNCSGFTAQQQADLDTAIAQAETAKATAC